MAVPGNAYVAQTGSTLTPPASPAAVATSVTAKTVLALLVGTVNQPSIVEFGISSDGASGTLLVELGYLTAATAGTGTAGAAMQVRGWPVQTSAHTHSYNYSASPRRPAPRTSAPILSMRNRWMKYSPRYGHTCGTVLGKARSRRRR
jgi:hypothetical protein